MKPFSDLIRAIAGPAAEEVGMVLHDHVLAFRLKRQVRLFEQTARMLEAAGLKPHRVPYKLLTSIVQNASLEEDDDLQDRWAALLANNATGDGHEAAFPEILKQLSPVDARLLSMCFHEVVHQSGGASIETGQVPPWHAPINISIAKWEAERARLEAAAPGRQGDAQGKTVYTEGSLALENLTRLGLIAPRSFVTINSVPEDYKLSQLGYRFALACEDPDLLKKARAILAGGHKPGFRDFP